MQCLIATDSFKDALSAPDVCAAIARGVREAWPAADILLSPLADGGEGTAEILTLHAGGTWVTAEARDPLSRPLNASYGWVEGEQRAFIDMAQASGLPLLAPNERDPRRTTTLGTGDLIRDALARGVRHIILGIGGSATNDGGMGMAHALGYRFLDAAGRELEPVGGNLAKVAAVEDRGRAVELDQVRIEVITDVRNPLLGPKGATRVYGPQKGAAPEVVEALEAGMRHYAGILRRFFRRSFDDLPGAGAAGGLGAGAAAFLGAALKPGIDTVMAYAGLEEKLEGTDLIFTGEGRLDGQTGHGKLISGIAARARARRIPVVALCGSLEADAATLRELGVSAAFSILPGPMALEEALRRTEAFLERTAREVCGLWGAARATKKI